MSVTVITALYDIQREKKGDGRKMEEYFNWIHKTFQLNVSFVVFTEKKLTERLKQLRNTNIRYIEQELVDVPYYKYKDDIQKIIQLPEYKKRIKHPDRIECNWPLYNIIQYSKLGWLNQAMDINPFNSEYFFWMDAGCSRFFYNVNIKKQWPSEKGMNMLKQNKFVIQGRRDLHSYKIDDNFYWDSSNLLIGTLFGGCKESVLNMGKLINEEFEGMIKNNRMNNEQLVLAILWKRIPGLFNIYINNTSKHLPLFEILSK